MAGSATVVALLMALSPAAGAITPHVFAAPYRHTAVLEGTSTASSGPCKRSDLLIGNHWLPKSGNVTGYALSSASGCAPSPFGSQGAAASAADNLEIAFPFNVSRSHGYNLSVNFTYDYTLVAAVSGSVGCPAAKPVKGQFTYDSCALSVQAGSLISMQLWDASNKTGLFGSNDYQQLPQNYSYESNYSYCYSGNCYWYNYSYGCGGTGNFTPTNCAPSGGLARGTHTLWVNTGANCGNAYGANCYSWENWTLVPLHHYWVFVTVYFYTSASLYSYGAHHAVLASINGATLGNKGWSINSVTVA
ncbi:MAG TPA: hypothetical protein VFF67_01655 [Thermoplasmata archaeon]|nr:hypothetical protein [Thermoplasmata archaeon]